MNNIENSSKFSPGLAQVIKEAQQFASPNQMSANISKVNETANITTKPLTEVEVVEAIELLNQIVVPKSLSFRLDQESGRSVVTVFDNSTDEVIRQIPAEDALRVARKVKNLQDEMLQSIGILVDSKV